MQCIYFDSELKQCRIHEYFVIDGYSTEPNEHCETEDFHRNCHRIQEAFRIRKVKMPPLKQPFKMFLKIPRTVSKNTVLHIVKSLSDQVVLLPSEVDLIIVHKDGKVQAY